MKWWTLPGPASFLAGLESDVGDGMSVVLAVPTHGPADIAQAFADTLRSRSWSVELIAACGDADPLIQLTDRLYIQPPSWGNWSVSSLFSAITGGRVVIVDGIDGRHWEQWRSFLMDFEVTSRGSQSHGRTVIVAIVRGVPPRRLSAPGAALVVKRWYGVVGELDSLIYIDSRLRTRGARSAHHKLLVRQIAGLAMWDLALAEHLVARPEADLFEPLDLLREALANMPGTPARGTEWETGGTESYDGTEFPHALLLAATGDPRGELTRRLWAAQASELLPKIELRRREVASQLARYVSCPFWINGDEKIETLDGLELGRLAHVVRINKVDTDLRGRIEFLAQLRNTLAHLRPLGARDARHSLLHS